jgi:hypothetical protein
VTYVQADIVPAIVAWLSEQPEIVAGLGVNVPETWTADSDPQLVVADDGGPVIMPIKSQHTIRLTAWATGRTQARQIVATAAGLLVFGRPSGVGHVNRDMGGILDARDKATGAMLASVLITMHARTVSA